jgi:protein required for attachment to host cells
MKWLVVANRIGAEIFEVKSGDVLKSIKKMENPLGREKNKAMTTDKPGLSRGKFKGASPHSMTGEKNPHEDAAVQFAKKLAAYLKKEANKQHTLGVQIVAGPRMIGKIKTELGTDSNGQFTWTAKNIEKVPQEKWPKLLGLRG